MARDTGWEEMNRITRGIKHFLCDPQGKATLSYRTILVHRPRKECLPEIRLTDSGNRTTVLVPDPEDASRFIHVETIVPDPMSYGGSSTRYTPMGTDPTLRYNMDFHQPELMETTMDTLWQMMKPSRKPNRRGNTKYIMRLCFDNSLAMMSFIEKIDDALKRSHHVQL